MQAEIGIIGGTGVYDPQFLTEVEEVKIHTPYGPPSDTIMIGKLEKTRIAFIPRHSRKHTISPSDVNARANIFALKTLGVKRILAPSAVGSLKEEIKPGDVVIVDQFIDRTTKREQSFYKGPQICHISVDEPMCNELRKVIIDVSKKNSIRFHNSGTYVCIEGPRFSTKAESFLFRSWGADIIGMTLVPECVLAREAELCYASIATVTDYDVWRDKPVNAEEVMKTMRDNMNKIRKIISETILRIPKEVNCNCNIALKNALV